MFRFYKILRRFCKNSKVVSSDFSIMKNIFALSSSSLSIKLICCLKSGFSNSIYCLDLLQLVFNISKNIHSPINCQLCNPNFYQYSIFSYASSLFFTGTSKTLFLSINTLIFFISTFCS